MHHFGYVHFVRLNVLQKSTASHSDTVGGAVKLNSQIFLHNDGKFLKVHDNIVNNILCLYSCRYYIFFLSYFFVELSAVKRSTFLSTNSLRSYEDYLSKVEDFLKSVYVCD